MKRTNRKGFTIVELVIVIAVIAILAAVMIPAFSGTVKKARESAALQEAQAVYKDVYAVDLADGELDGNEGTSPIPTDAKMTKYDPKKSDTTHFEYKASNGYTVTFNGTTWSKPTETT